jgi:hypothetical protein
VASKAGGTCARWLSGLRTSVNAALGQVRTDGPQPTRRSVYRATWSPCSVKASIWPRSKQVQQPWPVAPPWTCRCPFCRSHGEHNPRRNRCRTTFRWPCPLATCAPQHHGQKDTPDRADPQQDGIVFHQQIADDQVSVLLAGHQRLLKAV